MCEVNFEFITGYLQKEIERLNESKGSDAMDAVKKGMSEFLIQLLDWIKTAIRVERDRIQRARDSIDATLYAMMSKSDIKFNNDFRKMIDHMSGNALKPKEQPVPSHKNEIGQKECSAMGAQLEIIESERENPIPLGLG